MRSAVKINCTMGVQKPDIDCTKVYMETTTLNSPLMKDLRLGSANSKCPPKRYTRGAEREPEGVCTRTSTSGDS